jgi:hypothetical protein
LVSCSGRQGMLTPLWHFIKHQTYPVTSISSISLLVCSIGYLRFFIVCYSNFLYLSAKISFLKFSTQPNSDSPTQFMALYIKAIISTSKCQNVKHVIKYTFFLWLLKYRISHSKIDFGPGIGLERWSQPEFADWRPRSKLYQTWNWPRKVTLAWA